MSKYIKAKGFTIAELLIVVAIIGVLTAIGIPIFTGSLEKARRATDIANAREIRSAVTYSIIDGVVQIHGDDVGIAVLVSRDRIKVTGCIGKDKPLAQRQGKKITCQVGQNLNDTLGGISQNIRCKQRKNTWYAVIVYGDGSSYYWEGKDSPILSKGTRYDWSTLGK